MRTCFELSQHVVEGENLVSSRGLSLTEDRIEVAHGVAEGNESIELNFLKVSQLRAFFLVR